MEYKQTLWRGVALAALLGATCSSAFGTNVTLTQGSYQSGIGGEFKATVSDDSLDAYLGTYSPLTGNAVTNTFQTFCIEYNEHFNYGVANGAQVSGAAINGGTATQDTVSVGVGWLYSQFAQGTLTGYAFGGTQAQRRASAGQLQNAIWWLEGEISTSQAANPFILEATSALAGIGATVPNLSPNQGGSGLAANDYNGQNAASFGVFALNLGPFSGNTQVRQDQLIFKKVANQQVPDGGATLMLFGMGLAGLGALQRKLRRAD